MKMSMRAVFVVAAVALSASLALAECPCDSNNPGACSSNFPQELNGAPGTSYECRDFGGDDLQCLGSNDGTALGYDAFDTFTYAEHTSCFPLDAEQGGAEFFFSADEYSVRAVQSGCSETTDESKKHVFYCSGCFENCRSVSQRWVTDSTHKMTFRTLRDENGGVSEAAMSGWLTNVGTGGSAKVTCSFTDFTTDPPSGMGWKYACGSNANNAAFWDLFNEVNCQIKFTSLGGQTVSFVKSSKMANIGLQIGTHNAFLKGGFTPGQVGAASWLEVSGVDTAGVEGECRFRGSHLTPPLAYGGQEVGGTVDFNFLLDPICKWACDDDFGAIGGDPHLRGFLGQSFNLLGETGHVYNIISSPHMQYNVRLNASEFVINHRHATSITQMGMRVGSHTVRVDVSDGKHPFLRVHVNGEALPASEGKVVLLNEDGSEYLVRMGEPEEMRLFIVTRDYSFEVSGKLFRGQRILNDGIKLTNWVDGRTHHGLLGQTANPKAAPRLDTPEIVLDWDWPMYLEGSLADYDLPSADVLGMDYTFCTFDASE